MQLATEYIQHHGAKSITTAALLTKPWSTFDVDFHARSSEAWVIFPNEVRETIQLLTELWSEQGDNHPTIVNQLLEIGFAKDEVDLFCKPE